MTIPKAEEYQVRTFESALRAIQLLEQSEQWGYADRDLLCRLIRFILMELNKHAIVGKGSSE